MNLDETLIGEQIDNFGEVFRTKNIEMMVSRYASESVAFECSATAGGWSE